MLLEQQTMMVWITDILVAQSARECKRKESDAGAAEPGARGEPKQFIFKERIYQI